MGMQFDVHTLFAVIVVANALAAALLVFSWSQYRHVPALAIWGAGFLLGSIATGLLAARGEISDFWSIYIGNAALALGYGLTWAGVRSFAGRSVPIAAVVAGLVAWLVAGQLAFVYPFIERRVLLMASIVCCYLLMSAWELWRSDERGLPSRWPIIAILAIHATAFLMRIPLVGDWIEKPEASPLHFGGMALLVGEILFFVFCLAYLLGSIAHERVVLRHKLRADADALTGVANRRVFFSRGDGLVRRARTGRRPAVLLLFDLDDFKKINDTYGHPAGDNILKSLCAVAARLLRPADLFARIGGEEFACLLVDTTAAQGSLVAERIRAEFERLRLDTGGAPIHATVSIGLASVEDGFHSLAELVLAADRALYRAKAKGRNRVELTQGGALHQRARARAG